MRMTTRPATVLATVVATTLLSGCGLSGKQRAAVQRFSTATTALADVTAEDFTSLRTDVLAFRERRFEIDQRLDDVDDSERPPASGSELEQLIASLLPASASDETLDEGIEVEDLEARIEAVAAVREFGTLLGTLAAKGGTDEVNVATGKLLESINKIDGIDLAGSDASAIQQAVVAVAGMAIEAQRRKAVRTVVLKTSEVFPKIIKLIREDYDPEGFAWIRVLIEEGEAAVDVNNVLADMAAVAAEAARDPAASEDTGLSLSAAELALLREKSASLVIDVAGRIQLADDARPRIVGALDEFEKAHVELVAIVQNDQHVTLEKIESFLGTVDTLVRTYRALTDEPSP